MLHDVIYDNKRRCYCGPVAIAALTGVRLSVILATYDWWRDFPTTLDGRAIGIRGTTANENINVIHKLGGFVADFYWLPIDDGITSDDARELPTLHQLWEKRIRTLSYK